MDELAATNVRQVELVAQLRGKCTRESSALAKLRAQLADAQVELEASR